MTTISFSCSACGKAFQVGSERAGQQGKCPQCGAAMQVPHAGGAPVYDDRWDDLPSPDAVPPVVNAEIAGSGQAGNPYAAPVAGPPAYGHGQPGQVGCPNCGHSNYSKVGFTWWGGLVGPWLFSHVRCNSCATTFNSKTGKSNNTAIAIYLGVGLGIGLLLGSRRRLRRHYGRLSGRRTWRYIVQSVKTTLKQSFATQDFFILHPSSFISTTSKHNKTRS